MPDEYPIQGKPSRLNVQCKWLVFISYNWQKNNIRVNLVITESSGINSTKLKVQALVCNWSKP